MNNNSRAPLELSIIIVNWNGGDLLTRSVESIVNSGTNTNFEVIIVDNNSTDQSLSLLEASDIASSLAGKLRIVRNSENLGFGRANNQAFALSTTPFLLLLNPDAELFPGAIDVLMETIKTDAKIAACGPRIVNTDGTTQTSVFFNPPRAWHTFFWQLGLYRLLPGKIRGQVLLGPHFDHLCKLDVPMLIGAAFLVRREVIEDIGGFNESFHMYAEDNEWCWRMRQAGWRLVFEPGAVARHHGGRSARQRWSSDENLRVRLDAEFKFCQLALSKWNLISNQLANYCVVSIQVLVRRVRGIEAPHLALVKRIHKHHLDCIFKSVNGDGPGS